MRYTEFYSLHFWKWRLKLKATFQITLTVDPGDLAVAPVQDLGKIGVPLADGTKLPISGGTAPYSLTNVVGTVPPGVTINSDGTLSGTPTAAGDFPLSIDVQDAKG